MPDRREFLGMLGATGILAKGALSSSASAATIADQQTAGQLRIALMQAEPAASDLDRNLEIARTYCKRAAVEGADVLLMPEMWSIGYRGFDDYSPETVSQWQAQAIDTDGPWVSEFKKLASELGLAIAVTYLQRWQGGPRNAVTLFDRHGNEVLTYAKVHTCDFAFEVALTPGDKWFTADLDTMHGPVKTGAMICFDREFPESMRTLMLGGAELVLTPNACMLDPLRLAQFQVRAYENATAVAITNYPAPFNNGNSTAFDAAGTSLGSAGEAADLYVVSLDLDALRHYRRNTLWGHAWRRPHRYGALTDQIDLAEFRRKDAYGKPFDSTQR